MKNQYQQEDERMHKRACDIADALVGDQGHPDASGANGDFCRYLEVLKISGWVNLLQMMREDERIDKEFVIGEMTGILNGHLETHCATKRWAGWLDVATGGTLRPDEFVDAKQHQDS